MSREIKFRAWDKDYNFMMLPDEIAPYNYEIITGEGKVMEFEERHSYTGTTTDWEDISDKRILMQYTGLKDKNGMEIYENDVCRDGEALYVVRYSDELGQWLLHLLENGTIMNNVRYLNSDVVTEMEINGNIYENPSLLEQS